MMVNCDQYEFKMSLSDISPKCNQVQFTDPLTTFNY